MRILVFFSLFLFSNLIYGSSDLAYLKAKRRLIKAVSSGNLRKIKAILNFGVDINMTNQQGDTPLHFAAASGRENIVRFLLENGAQIVTDKDKWTALHCAQFRKYKSIVKILERWPLQVEQARLKRIERRKKIPKLLLVHQRKHFSIDKFLFINWLCSEALELANGQVRIHPIIPKTTDSLPGD